MNALYQLKVMNLMKRFYDDHEVFYKKFIKELIIQANHSTPQISSFQSIKKIEKMVDKIYSNLLGLMLYVSTLASWKDGALYYRVVLQKKWFT